MSVPSMRQYRVRLSMLLTLILPGLIRAGELEVADVFTDHAVLQQGVALPVWGTADAREYVTVRLAGQTKSVQAAEDGSWQVRLSPLQSQSTGILMTVESGNQRKVFRDLLVGEVWFASGQSNMQMKLNACAEEIPTIREIVQSPSRDNIRLLRIDEPDSPQPLARRQNATPWQLDDPATRGNQSAVAYFFARQLHQELGVPVGIIDGSWGGKPIEGFIPRAQFEKHASLKPLLALAEQNKLDELAMRKGGVVIRNTAGMPGRIFNTRVAPIAPYAVRGFLWYQGESNAGRGEDPRNYRIKMRALVEGWRTTWSQPELPFYFVQLPAFEGAAPGWVRLREEQRRSLEIPHTKMAVTIDLRDSDIHPANKLDVGKRLALLPLANVYEKEIAFSGPLFKSAIIEGDSVRVNFDHTDGGLMVARKEGLSPPIPTPDLEPAHFELADENGKWYSAQASLDGSVIRVRSPDVKKPRAVRYACTASPANANLYNLAGLPASPFCSQLELLPWEKQ